MRCSICCHDGSVLYFLFVVQVEEERLRCDDTLPKSEQARPSRRAPTWRTSPAGSRAAIKTALHLALLTHAAPARGPATARSRRPGNSTGSLKGGRLRCLLYFPFDETVVGIWIKLLCTLPTPPLFWIGRRLKSLAATAHDMALRNSRSRSPLEGTRTRWWWGCHGKNQGPRSGAAASVVVGGRAPTQREGDLRWPGEAGVGEDLSASVTTTALEEKATGHRGATQRRTWG